MQKVNFDSGDYVEAGQGLVDLTGQVQLDAGAGQQAPHQRARIYRAAARVVPGGTRDGHAGTARSLGG